MAEAPRAEVVERLFASAEARDAALCGDIGKRLGEAVRTRGVASFVATGGTTPGALYDLLSETDLPWERVFVTLSDERWVDRTDASSNEWLVRKRLLKARAASARFVALKTESPTPAEGAPAVDAALAAIPRPFDAVLLGMGEDGHVASLFPHAAETGRAMDLSAPALVYPVTREGAAGASERLSLSFRALRDTRWTAILIQGDEKLAAARRIGGESDISELPVRGIVQQAAAPVEIWWAP